MPKKSGIPIGHRRALNRLLISGTLPPAEIRLAPGQWVKTLRVVYHMTQAQLARLSGVRQTYITLIERGRINPGLTALNKLFDAMFCDILLLPAPRRRPADVIMEKTRGVPTSEIWQQPGDRKYPRRPRGKWARRRASMRE